MAQVVGFLREDSTWGERETLRLLNQNLPKEYTVYVETPIRKKREIRYPDFIILTNYGVIVLEVKDWVIIEKVDPHGATIRTRSGTTRFEQNPVNTARELAIDLANELKSNHVVNENGEKIPWSYAALLFNLPNSVVTRVRVSWGEEFVISKSDAENPDILLKRLKNTFPAERMRPLSKIELDQVRRVIYPVVEIERPNQPPFVLDQQQEKLVAEPVREEKPPEPPKTDLKKLQKDLFAILKPEEEVESLPDDGKRISKNTAIRLVRGFSGSGKTLVLIQRARFLEAQFPAWNIAVLTYNKPLQEQLLAEFNGSRIKPMTFHGLCRKMLPVSDSSRCEPSEWLEDNQFDFRIIRKIGRQFVEREFSWLRSVGITDLETYLGVERHGIGSDGRLSADQRGQIFEPYAAYRSNLRQKNQWDWDELPLMVLDKLDSAELSPLRYDAILIDEAQDWAPSWFKVINQLVVPQHGLLFLADDPSQSIYRYFSWKEKGVGVVGRTRWLKVPYRNTFEIYRAAYSMIDGYEEIQSSLTEEGEAIKPDLSSSEMRRGALPLVLKHRSAADESAAVRSKVDDLKNRGLRDNQIAVLVRHRGDLEAIQTAMKGCQVMVSMIHRFKGLEMEAVIIPHLQKMFQGNEPGDEGAERRLLYMAMSRARSHLVMMYSGNLPAVFENLKRQNMADFLE